MRFQLKTLLRPLLTAAVLASLGSAAAQAQPVAHPVATFAGLDKITGRITRFDVYIGETVLFGALEITPRACYNRPSSDSVQRTSAFLEVDQRSLEGETERIFTGWMFADSPALNAVDHAVYDVWLIECKVTTNVPPPDQR
ncbi:MAG: glycosyl hydrolase family 5 [Pelagibacterium sp. SCN 63-23]|nr:MAG: glycosyl hydrolase family 5 [Pelagibacterium sp. SCN 63-23]